VKTLFRSNFTGALCIILCLSTAISGCGRSANPVQTWQPQDDELSCSSLLAAMDESEANIRKLLPKSEKTGKNVALGVAGAFLLVPWFFMDFSEAEKIEIDAYRNRYNHLSRIYRDHGCQKKGGRKVQELPDFFKHKNESSVEKSKKA
jgi:hypothetical protein